MILYRRSQLYQTIKYMERMQKGNREVIENKIKEHFMKIRKVVEGYELKMMSRLEELS